MVCHIGFGQYFVQRFVSCATPNDAKKSIWVGASVSLIVGGIFIPMIGMASISYFKGCDPVKVRLLLFLSQAILERENPENRRDRPLFGARDLQGDSWNDWRLHFFSLQCHSFHDLNRFEFRGYDFFQVCDWQCRNQGRETDFIHANFYHQ